MSEQTMQLGEIIDSLKRGVGDDIDLNVPFKGGRATPLSEVSFGGSPEYVELMLVNGADPNQVAGDMHPLVSAMCSFTGNDNRADIVALAELMLAHGLDVTVVTAGRTLLAEAAYYDLPELCMFLLENGCDPYAANPDGSTAIEVAAQSGSMDALLAICGVTGDNADDWTGAARMSLDDLFSNFVDPEPSVESRDGIGHTPLHLAAELGADHLLGELVEMGADLEARNQQGATPLFMALNSDLDADTAVTTIRTLVDLGARVDAKNDAGQSVAEVATDRRCPQAVVDCLASLA